MASVMMFQGEWKPKPRRMIRRIWVLILEAPWMIVGELGV